MKLSDRQKNWLSLAIIILITLLVSWPTLFNDFSALDDAGQITQNADIRSLDISSLSKMFTSLYLGMYQPLATLSFALEYHFFGINPLIVHAVNILWHLANTLLLFYFAWLLTGKKKLAWLIALLFAIHPVQVETVAWASARSNLIMTFFYLLSLITYLRLLRRPSKLKYFNLILFFILALFAKAPAVTLPLSLLAIDYYHDRLSLRVVMEKFFLIALSGIFIAITLVGKVNAYSFDPIQFNWLSRLTFIPYSLVSYVQKIIAPLNLQIFYPYPQSFHGWLNPINYLAWVLLGVLIYGAWLCRQRKLSMFGLLFFASTIITQLPWIPANQTISADRYLYLSGVGLFFIMLDNLSWLESKKSLSKKLVVTLLTVYLLSLSVFSYLRYLDWGDSAYLLEQAALAAPWSGLIYYHTSHAYLIQGAYSQALAYADQAIFLDPDNAYAFNLSASILTMYFQDYLPAINRFNQAIKKFPTCAICYYGRAYALTQLNNLPAALKDLDLAEKHNDQDASLAYKVYKARSELYMKLHDKDRSCRDLNNALKLQPHVALDELAEYCNN